MVKSLRDAFYSNFNEAGDKGKNIVIVLFFVAVNRNIENRIFWIWNNVMGERRELNPRVVDSQSTALIHLATSAPILN